MYKNQLKNILLFILLFSIINSTEVRPCIFEENKTSSREESANSINFNTKNLKKANTFNKRRNCTVITEDTNLLIARKIFDEMIPRTIPQDLLNDQLIIALLNFFWDGQEFLESTKDDKNRYIIGEAYFERICEFLHDYLEPVIKFSYYAGKVNLNTVLHVMELNEICLQYPHPNDNACHEATRSSLNFLKDVHITPICFDTLQNVKETGCDDLNLISSDLERDVFNNIMIVPLPRLEHSSNNDKALSNIWIPFKNRSKFNLRSINSASLLVRYYRSVSQCYKEKGLSPSRFNNNFKNWIFKNLENHLNDQAFYPGLGNVLNIYQTLQNYQNNIKVNKRSPSSVYKDSKIIIELEKSNLTKSKKLHTNSQESDKNKCDNNLFRKKPVAFQFGSFLHDCEFCERKDTNEMNKIILKVALIGLLICCICKHKTKFGKFVNTIRQTFMKSRKPKEGRSKNSKKGKSSTLSKTKKKIKKKVPTIEKSAKKKKRKSGNKSNGKTTSKPNYGQKRTSSKRIRGIRKRNRRPIPAKQPLN